MFKVGNRVKRIGPDFLGVKHGLIYEVTLVKIYTDKDIGISLKNDVHVYDIKNFEFVESDEKWILKSIDDVVTDAFNKFIAETKDKPCTCESHTLFHKGCICGHLKRRVG